MDEYMEDVSDVTGSELDEPIDVWVSTLVEQGVSITVHPDFIKDDETLEEYVEKEIKENYLGRIAAEIADGIRESDVDIESVGKEEI